MEWNARLKGFAPVANYTMEQLKEKGKPSIAKVCNTK
jgi:hypothetical protein